MEISLEAAAVIAESLGALAAVFGLGFVGVQIHRARQGELDLAEQRHRQSARTVTAWVELLPLETAAPGASDATLFIHNGSGQPVREFAAWLIIRARWTVKDGVLCPGEWIPMSIDDPSDPTGSSADGYIEVPVVPPHADPSDALAIPLCVDVALCLARDKSDEEYESLAAKRHPPAGTLFSAADTRFAFRDMNNVSWRYDGTNWWCSMTPPSSKRARRFGRFGHIKHLLPPWRRTLA